MRNRAYVIGVLVFATFIMVASNMAETQEITFQGICDGSAAVKLGNDKILVAYDENNSLYVFDIRGGKYIREIDLIRTLKLQTPDPDPKEEIDIEAATIAGDRIWWIGSHGRSKKGEALNRRILFATNIPSEDDLTDMMIAAGPLDLIDVFLNSTEVGEMLKAANPQDPKDGGISIEGLATIGDTGLLVGFRSPLSGQKGLQGDALVVKLVPDGNKFKVEKATLLNLENRGIRDMINTPKGYLIIAGPPGEVKNPNEKDFALYAWDGSHPLLNADSLKKTELSLKDLNAEAIVDLDKHWLILSDDGKKTGRDAKNPNLTCDEISKGIRKKSGEEHSGVYFRAKMIPKESQN